MVSGSSGLLIRLSVSSDPTERYRDWFAVEPMLGTGRTAKESENSNEYFRFSLTISWLLIALVRRDLMREYVSTLAISEVCLYYGIILKSPKRQRAAQGRAPGRFLPVVKGRNGPIAVRLDPLTCIRD